MGLILAHSDKRRATESMIPGKTLRALLQHVDGMMPWAPGWLSGTAIMAGAAAAALLVHWLLVRLILGVPMPGRGRGFLETFVATTIGPSRLAVVVLALWAALPSTGFAAAVSLSIGQVLLAGFIVLVGWSAMRALDVASKLYLRRFRLDVDENLLARKHVTQVRVLKRAGDVLIALVTAAAALMTFASVRAYGLSLFASAGAASLVVGLAARPLLTNLIAGVQIAVTQPFDWRTRSSWKASGAGSRRSPAPMSSSGCGIGGAWSCRSPISWRSRSRTGRGRRPR